VRINRGHIFVVMVILILVAAFVLRFFTAAPVGIIAIVVFVIVRKMRKKMEEEARRQQEESRTDDAYQETYENSYQEAWKAEDAYRRNETDKKDSIITCEYCGSKVDTEKHAVCPHCGGPYGDNEEWKEIRRKRNA